MIPYIPPRDDPPDPPPRLQLDDDAAEDFDDNEGEGEGEGEHDPNLDDRVQAEEPARSWEEELVTAGSPEDLITVNTYRYAYEAELAKSYLQKEGITAYVADTDTETVSTDWFLGGSVGHIKLLVPRSQIKEAVALLTAKMDQQVEEITEDEDVPETAKCLACGATMGDNESSCTACGWTYNDGGGEQAIQAP